MYKNLSVPEFREYVEAFRQDKWDSHAEELKSCTPEILESVVEVLSAYYNDESLEWDETESKIWVRLADGRYGCLEEWADSSGHG